MIFIQKETPDLSVSSFHAPLKRLKVTYFSNKMQEIF